MSLLNPEYKFTCKKCGNTWYMTAKDIREEKKGEKEIMLLNTKKGISILPGTVRRIEEEKALLKNKGFSHKRCPACGSQSIQKGK